MTFRHRSRWIAVPALLLLLALPAHGQYRRNFGGVQGAAQPTNIKGTFISTNGSQIQVANAAGRPAIVMVGPQTQISITGTAEPEYLKPNMHVEFTAEVTDAKNLTLPDKIDHLTLFTPSDDRPLGFYPAADDGGGDKKKSKAGKADADAGDDATAKPHGARPKKTNDLSADDPLPTKSSKGRPGLLHGPGTYTVRGTLRMCKNGQFTVVTGHGPPVKAQLSDSPSIDVDVTELRFAQRDDSISVNGVSNPARPNLVMAESVTIELAQPLTGKKAAHASKSSTTHVKKKKDADDDNLPGN